MEKQKLFVWLPMIAFLMFSGTGLWAQSPSYTCSIMNQAQVSCSAFEFDVYLKRTGTVDFRLVNFQLAIPINPAMIASGATINVAPVTGSSGLNSIQVPGPELFAFLPASSTILVTPLTPSGVGSATTISSTEPGTKLMRIQVSSTLPFVTAQSPSPSWCFNKTSCGYITKIFAYVGSGSNPSDVDVTSTGTFPEDVIGYSKPLSLHVLLEGLTKPRIVVPDAEPVSPPPGTMYEAMNELIEPKWGAGVADTITVEFYNPGTYTLAQRFTAVHLLTNGSASIKVPISLVGSYWIRISTRNHVAVWSSSPVSVACPIDYNFTDASTRAYENSGGSPTALKSIGSGKYAMWVGSMQNDTEVVQFIDTDDGSAIVPFVINGDVGYLVPDMDGAGWVDIDDAVYIDVNVPPGVYEQRPQD